MSRISCVVVLVLLAVLHSVLGERKILRPLFAPAVVPPRALPLGRAFTARTLRFVWHLLSVAWLSLGVLVLRGDGTTLGVVGATLLVSGALALVVSRGRHFAWALFVVGGASALLGPRLGVAGPVAAVVAAGVLALVAGAHGAWVLGARWGISVALPEVAGRPAFVPSRGLTAVVAATFVAAGAIVTTAARAGTPVWGFLTLAGAVVFALRAVGDFRLVGLTKRVHGTAFARWDDALFTPLCVLLATCFAIVGARALG